MKGLTRLRVFGLCAVLGTASLQAISATPAQAAPWCSEYAERDDLCWVELRELHPTQFAVGEIAVREKAKELSELSKKELKEKLWKKPIIIVIGPGETFFVVDHHHQGLALLKIGEKDAPASVLANFSQKSWSEFYQSMLKRGWFYLFDENGKGPLSPERLPSSLTQLKDDPYRSLAWAVREEGGYKKTDEMYADFAWADFFRSRITIESGAAGFKKALRKALDLAQTHAAHDLPGYIGQ